jgi:hypothetical protein
LPKTTPTKFAQSKGSKHKHHKLRKKFFISGVPQFARWPGKHPKISLFGRLRAAQATKWNFILFAWKKIYLWVGSVLKRNKIILFKADYLLILAVERVECLNLLRRD